MTAVFGALEPRRASSVFGSAWRHRQLVLQLTIREVEGIFRGSMLGKVWSVVVPLMMLGMYTLVFGVVLGVRWPGEPRSELRVALLYFAGLLLSNFFVECINRAPTLLIENPAYIKRVVFPLEVLSWVAVATALFRAAIGGIVLIAYYLVMEGLPPPSAVVVPFALAPLVLIALGLVWIFSAFGVYVRDLRHAMVVLIPAMMYLSPIFYPLSSVPAPFRVIFYVNPLTYAVETIRGALFFGTWPSAVSLACYAFVGWLVARVGSAIFTRLRPGFADVV